MSSGTNAWESENAMHDILRSARHVLAMDAFANTSTLSFLQAYPSADVFYVELYEKIYAKFTYTILCGFKNPTWILCECDFYIENMFT